MKEKFLRLSKYMEYKGLTNYRVTKDCGISVGLLNKARIGKTDLGRETIEKIVEKYTDLSRIWLLTGEGEMLNSQSQAVAGHVQQCPLTFGD